MEHREINILETTLRDGNYLVNFQFTAADTAWLCRELENCGVRLIEIGHGLGLGASRVQTPAAASDADYIGAARQALGQAKFGMFAIPGIATLDDIAMAADLGMDFVRIGSNVDRVRSMEPFIDEARRRGMFVCTNFMKSYCLSPQAFGEIGALAESFGSQMNYLVDSAGGMLPEDVRAYLQALDAQTSIPMGFHGHDNIRLAIANSLTAIDCGVSYVDTTLFGIGRGSGNAATELLAALMKQRYGTLADIDDMRLIRLAEREVAPLLHHRHQESISISLGLAQVHSMYLDLIVERSKAEGLDPHRVIRQVGRVSRLTVDDEVLDAAVAAVRAEGPGSGLPQGGLLQMPATHSVGETVAAAETLAEKLGVPCEIWLAGSRGGTAVDVEKTETAVQVCVFGEPEPVLAALCRAVSSVWITPALRHRLASLRGQTTRPIQISHALPPAIASTMAASSNMANE